MTMGDGRLFLAVVSCLVTLTVSGGMVQGIPGLLTILSRDGFYANLCSGGETTCDDRTEALQNIGWLGFVSINAGQMLGFLLDYVGPRATAVAGLVVASMGFTAMALIEVPGDQWLIGPAYFVTGFGGIAPYIAAMNIGNLFDKPSIFVSLNAGMFAGAGWMYLGLQELYLIGAPRRTLFLGYAVLCLLAALLAFAVYPRTKYVKGDKCSLPISCESSHTGAHEGEADASLLGSGTAVVPSLEGSHPHGTAASTSYHGQGKPPTAKAKSKSTATTASRRQRSASEGRQPSRARAARSGIGWTERSSALSVTTSAATDARDGLLSHKHSQLARMASLQAAAAHVAGKADEKAAPPSALRELLSFHLWGFAFWYGVQLLAQSFYSSALRDVLRRKGDTGSYANLFDVLGNIAFVFNPFVGLFIARYGHLVPFVLALAAGQGFILIAWFGGLEMQVLGFLLLSFNRANMFSAFYSYLGVGFDARMYGRLLAMLCVAAVGLRLPQALISKFALITEHGNYGPAWLLLLASLSPWYLWVLYVWRRQRRAETEDPSTTKLHTALISDSLHITALSPSSRYSASRPDSLRGRGSGSEWDSVVSQASLGTGDEDTATPPRRGPDGSTPAAAAVTGAGLDTSAV